MTNTYLDVGVVRIGEYLTRVPKLKQLRSASAAISSATRTNEMSGTFTAPGLEGVVGLNSETGDADGVMHLTVAAGHEPRDAARLVLEGLRVALPGAQLRATWAQAEDYPSAFLRMVKTSDQLLDWLPSTNEFPVARPCGSRTQGDNRGCGQRPGAAWERASDLCPDCEGRSVERLEDARGGRSEELLDSIGKRPTELSNLPPRDTKPPESNHVAVVAMDGNGVGGLFSRLLADGDTDTIRRVSKSLSDAIQHAFKSAAGALVRADGLVPVVPVALGGDDVIVVLAATDAWTFVRVFQASFDERIREQLGDKASGVSMTSGVVFHQSKEPITQTIAMAESLMTDAKRATSGAEAAVSWIDTTSDSVNSASSGTKRPVVALQTIEDHSDQLVALAGKGASLRKNLVRMISELDSLPLSDEDRRDAIAAQANRTGSISAVSPFPYPAGMGSETIPLSVALDLARWWK